MTHSAEELGAKMDALGMWELLEPYNFAVKPRGTAFPYFCTAMRENSAPVKVRFVMLEGWQTLHDFVRTRMDNNYGFYSTPAEMPHFELVVAKDLPIVPEYALEVDFGLRIGLMTQDARPRSVYALVAADARTGERVIDSQTAIAADGGLRSLWESMPPRLLKELVARGKIPGEIKVRSGRVFRMLRPLCMELPFKLSLHEKLDHLP